MTKITGERGVGKVRKTSKALDRRIDKLEKRVGSLEKQIRKLSKSKKKKTSKLEKRISKLEENNKTIDSILFPEDPIANASRIIKDLKKAFPPTEGRYVFGPMLTITWGGNKKKANKKKTKKDD